MPTEFLFAKPLYKDNSKHSLFSWSQFIVDSVLFNNCVKLINYEKSLICL